MKPPQRLNDKHRKAAQLMVKGLRLADIGRQVGYNPNYLSFLSHECPVFQECLADYRRQSEQAYADSLERMYCEMFRLDELRELRNRRRRRRAG
jgi:hypothetical protein